MPEIHRDTSSTSNDAAPLRLAMLGMIPGNGHPYSWSAIVNGYDRAAMESCPYPVIPRYLGAQAAGSVGIPGVRVTQIWTDDPAEAAPVARAALISHVAKRPEDVIGQVDAVLIATDDGFDHLARARPFVEAGLPVFVDKPLALRVEDMRQFIAWQKAGAKIQSSSGLRFSPELDNLTLDSLAGLRWIAGLSCKTWERYGIHVLEPAARILGPGFVSVRLETGSNLVVAHVVHRSGVHVSLPVIADGGATFGTMHLVSTAGERTVVMADTYTAFRRQLVGFVDYVRTGITAYPFSDTIELMAVLIAGLRSRAEGSRSVNIEEIQAELLL